MAIEKSKPLRRFSERTSMNQNWKKIVEMYSAGAKVQDICETVGVADCTVYRALRACGIPLRREIDEGKIMALHKAGWNPKDIAGDMGLTEGAVYEVLRRNRCTRTLL